MFYHYPALGEEHSFQEFCKDVFNQIYATNDFQLYKTKGSVQHGIDSYSIHQQIVIQSKKKKLLRSDKELEKELLSDLNETVELVKNLPFQFRILVFATNTKKYGSIENVAAILSQSYSYQIKFFCWEDFEPEITKYPILRRIYFPNFSQPDTNYPKILSRLPHIDKSLVIGRSIELKTIKTLLSVSNSAVLINGMGGIGKTTLLKLTVADVIHNYKHILWIDYGGIRSGEEEEDLLIRKFTEDISLLINLNLKVSTELSNKELLSVISNKLSNIDGQNLLVIDNAPQAYTKISRYLPGFPNWRTLISSREKIVGMQSVEIRYLDINESLILFYQHYSLEQNDSIAKEILNFLGYHTLTIELLAKTANKRRLKLNELQISLEKQGLNISKTAKVTSIHDPLQSPTNYFNYLLDIFPISNLNDSQQSLLAALSVIPSEFISYDNLKLMYNVGDDDNDFFENISNTTDSGWLTQDGDHYQMHQVIQEVIREKLMPDDRSCQDLILNLTSILLVDFGQNPFRVKKFVRYAEVLHTFIGTDSIDFARLYSALGLRSEDFKEYGKAAVFYHRAETIYKSFGDVHLTDLADTYNSLQSAYKMLGKIDTAFTYQLQALSIQEQTLDPNDFALTTSYNNIALLYEIRGDLYNALKFMKRALISAEYFLKADHPYLASTYSNFSILLHGVGDNQQAFDYQKKAYDIRMKTLEEDHPQIDESLNNMAMMHHAVGQLDLAEVLIRKSISFKERIYGPDSSELGTTYNNLAAIYLDRKLLREAEAFQLKAIKLEENALGKNHHELATSYSTLAIIKSHQKQFTDSIFFAQKAIDILRLNFPNGHRSIFTNMEFIRITRMKIVQSFSKTGRNHLCPCGSSKKYKVCCGK